MTMQSLPRLQTTREVEAILAGFPANARIERHDSIIVVYAPNGTRVLSAARRAVGKAWHVMAVPGLLVPR